MVDTRNNGGGDLVADLAMFLNGKKFMDYETISAIMVMNPTSLDQTSISLVSKPTTATDIVMLAWLRKWELGKLGGIPVPGTCSLCFQEGLMDTGIRWGVPTVGCRDTNGNYLENAQTEPDWNWRMKMKSEYGIDQQLELAVKELLKELNEKWIVRN